MDDEFTDSMNRLRDYADRHSGPQTTIEMLEWFQDRVEDNNLDLATRVDFEYVMRAFRQLVG